MFGRAAIRLGIGPHSSCVRFNLFIETVGRMDWEELLDGFVEVYFVFVSSRKTK